MSPVASSSFLYGLCLFRIHRFFPKSQRKTLCLCTGALWRTQWPAQEPRALRPKLVWSVTSETWHPTEQELSNMPNRHHTQVSIRLWARKNLEVREKHLASEGQLCGWGASTERVTVSQLFLWPKTWWTRLEIFQYTIRVAHTYIPVLGRLR